MTTNQPQLSSPEERAARLEYAQQIAAETAKWSERKLRMTYAQDPRPPKAREVPGESRRGENRAE